MNISIVGDLRVPHLGRLFRRVLDAVGVAEAAFFDALDAFSGYEDVRRRLDAFSGYEDVRRR